MKSTDRGQVIHLITHLPFREGDYKDSANRKHRQHYIHPRAIAPPLPPCTAVLMPDSWRICSTVVVVMMTAVPLEELPEEPELEPDPELPLPLLLLQSCELLWLDVKPIPPLTLDVTIVSARMLFCSSTMNAAGPGRQLHRPTSSLAHQPR